MVQFLSIIFVFDYFCWVFQKFPFFCVTLYKGNVAVCVTWLGDGKWATAEASTVRFIAQRRYSYQ